MNCRMKIRKLRRKDKRGFDLGTNLKMRISLGNQSRFSGKKIFAPRYKNFLPVICHKCGMNIAPPAACGFANSKLIYRCSSGWHASLSHPFLFMVWRNLDCQCSRRSICSSSANTTLGNFATSPTSRHHSRTKCELFTFESMAWKRFQILNKNKFDTSISLYLRDHQGFRCFGGRMIMERYVWFLFNYLHKKNSVDKHWIRDF